MNTQLSKIYKINKLLQKLDMMILVKEFVVIDISERNVNDNNLSHIEYLIFTNLKSDIYDRNEYSIKGMIVNRFVDNRVYSSISLDEWKNFIDCYDIIRSFT